MEGSPKYSPNQSSSSICGQMEESAHHLFFEFAKSQELWVNIWEWWCLPPWYPQEHSILTLWQQSKKFPEKIYQIFMESSHRRSFVENLVGKESKHFQFYKILRSTLGEFSKDAEQRMVSSIWPNAQKLLIVVATKPSRLNH